MIGKAIQITYDARPLIALKKHFKAEVIKETKTGFKVKNLDEPGLYEDVVFRRDGTARGWNTLTWNKED